MADIKKQDLERLFRTLGARLQQPALLYVLGGSALLLLGNSRRTLDFDFVGSDLPDANPDELNTRLTEIAAELHVALEPIPFAEFIPLPPDAATRHRKVGQYGNLTVMVFDPYSIALSKLERGFKTDLEDIHFLLQKRIITLAQLETIVHASLARATEFHMDAEQMLVRFASLQQFSK